MEADANVVEVVKTWNMIISFLFLVGDKAQFQTFNCSVKNAIEVNQIAATVKFIIKKSVSTVVMTKA